jgi:hypothetical protein
MSSASAKTPKGLAATTLEAKSTPSAATAAAVAIDLTAPDNQEDPAEPVPEKDEDTTPVVADAGSGEAPLADGIADAVDADAGTVATAAAAAATPVARSLKPSLSLLPALAAPATATTPAPLVSAVASDEAGGAAMATALVEAPTAPTALVAPTTTVVATTAAEVAEPVDPAGDAQEQLMILTAEMEMLRIELTTQTEVASEVRCSCRHV